MPSNNTHQPNPSPDGDSRGISLPAGYKSLPCMARDHRRLKYLRADNPASQDTTMRGAQLGTAAPSGPNAPLGATLHHGAADLRLGFFGRLPIWWGRWAEASFDTMSFLHTVASVALVLRSISPREEWSSVIYRSMLIDRSIVLIFLMAGQYRSIKTHRSIIFIFRGACPSTNMSA